MKRAILVVIFAANAAAVGRFATIVSRALRSRFPIDYGEGLILDQALRLARFENIYPRDLSHPPYAISNYPPTFILLHVPFIRLFGAAYWYGRGLSELSMVVCAALIAILAWRLTHHRVASAVSGFTFLCLPPTVIWGQFDRVDSAGLALSLAALSIVIGRPPSGWRIGGAALLLVASIYTRQSNVLTGPVTLGVWLLAQHQRRAAITLILAIGGMSLIALIALVVATHGGFWFHIVTATRAPLSLERLEFFVSILTPAMAVEWGCIGVALVLALAFRPAWAAVMIPYSICAIVVALGAAKLGSTINYFLEVAVAGSLAVGILLAFTSRRQWLYTLLIVGITADNVALAASPLYDDLIGRLNHQRQFAALLRLVKATPAPVLADEMLGLLPLAGRSIYYEPFSMTVLADQGLWDESGLVADITHERFAMIMIRYSNGQGAPTRAFWTPRVYGAIREHYERVAEVPFEDGAFVAISVRPGDVTAPARRLAVEWEHAPQTLGRR